MIFYIILLKIKVSGLLSIISRKNKQYSKQFSKKYSKNNLDNIELVTSVYNTLTSENDRMKEKLDDIEEIKQKMDNIEEILVDECYKDAKKLSYTGDVWTMNLLKEKALQIGIPIIDWDNSRLSSIAYVIRVSEQIHRISDIVCPKYNEEQETYGMHIDNILDEEGYSMESDEYSSESDEYSSESEEYTSDSEWLPESE
jgi:hypothetical protein